MRAGTVRARSFARGLQAVELVFVEAAGAERLLPPVIEAFLCEKCAALTLHGAPSESLECFECGALIAPDADRCALCNWSWKQT
jgi:ribosomal protein L40E